ncbi:MAG: diguanylate cyclase [Truepera sp.]|nr:diguanylate cyclase [Truepera sp.]
MERPQAGFWSGFPLNLKGLAVVGPPLIALVVASLLTLDLMRKRREADGFAQIVGAVRAEVDRLQGLVLKAGIGDDEFLLTGDEAMLVPSPDLAAALERIRTLLLNESVLHLLPIVDRFGHELEALAKLLGSASLGGEGVGAPENDGGFAVAGQLRVENLNRSLLELQDSLQVQFDAQAIRQEQTEARFTTVLIVNLFAGISGSLLGLLVFGLIYSRSRGHREAPDVQGLDIQLGELAERSRQVTLMNELSTALLRCDELDESFFRAVQAKVGALVPGASGALFLYRSDRRRYEMGTAWGEAGPVAKAAIDVSKTGAFYPVPARLDAFQFRYPLMAQGQHLGILAVMTVDTLSSGTEQLYSAVADMVSLSITNLRLRASLEEQAIRDPLTGLYNRRHFEGTLEDEIRHADRTDRPLSVIMADIDYFKAFNDRYGHGAGDEVLRAIGKLMNSTFRVRDIPCRHGGEEFVIILPETYLVDAAARAERLVEQVRDLSVDLANGLLEMISISVGVAAYPEHGATPWLLVGRADEALYRAKEEGRNRVVLAR